MKLVFYKPHEVSGIWDEIAPQFARVVEKAVHGEYTLENLRDMAIAGRIHLGVAREEDGTAVMAMAFEFMGYPSGAVSVNVLAMAGKNLNAFMTEFVPPFKRFCREAGASWIECSVSPGMERIHRRYGFRTVYRNLRMSVED